MSAALKRLGLVIPSVNVVIEDDLRRFLPAGIGAHVARVRLTGTSPEELARVLDDLPAAASLLADSGLDAIGLACTGASMTGEAGSESALSERIAAVTGRPATNTVEALFEALRALDGRRVLLFSPFDDRFNAAEAMMLERGGFRVARTIGLGIADPRRCAALTPDEIVASAVAGAPPDADVVFLSCANIRGFEAAAPLEAALGRPVVTSNQVVLWAMLRLIGSGRGVRSGGRLFSV